VTLETEVKLLAVDVSIAATMTSPVVPTKSPPSPTSSFYAFSDDEEGDYDTITHKSTGRGVKLLYSKSKASLAEWAFSSVY